MLHYILLGLVVVQFFIIIFLLYKKKEAFDKKPEFSNSPESVRDYYDETTEKFLEVYGEIIQAFRTKNVSEYLEYTIENLKIEEGMVLLDAGCGVGGPAIYFSKQVPNIKIDACTISEVQCQKAIANVSEAGLDKSINVKQADYHKLEDVFYKNAYDRVYFLESFGHSNDKKKLLDSVWEVLKPGGMVYIKDLFRREVEDEWEQLYINKICQDINDAYQYHVADLNEILSFIRKKGYILHFVKIPNVERDAFENLTISNDFQNLFDIGKIESWDDYVFPIDFFEILAEKPKYNLQEQMHLYFMNREE